MNSLNKVLLSAGVFLFSVMILMSEVAQSELLSSEDVCVVSYNLDANRKTLGERAEGMAAILLSCHADSIGVQEAVPAWVREFNQRLGDYDHVGLSAEGEKPFEHSFGTYIYYRKDKYRVIDSGTFWLSTTPDNPSKYSDTVDCNRTCCWAILENIKTGFRYVHMNSHLDWLDTKATDYQIQLIQKKIRYFDAMGLPVFATGDYNTTEGSAIYKKMPTAGCIADAKFVAKETMNLGTNPDYGKTDSEKLVPIDYCFVTENRMTVNKYRVISDKYKEKYVSDHYGIQVVATVNPCKPALPQEKSNDSSEQKKVSDQR